MLLRTPMLAAVLAVGLVSGGLPLRTVVIGPAQGAGAPVSAMPTPSPAASLTATYRVRTDGRLRVDLRSDARVAQVRYRTTGPLRKVTRQLHHHAARVLVPAGSRHIRARAMATKRLRRGHWVAAEPAPTPGPSTGPTVSPPPTDPPGQNPAPTAGPGPTTTGALTEVARLKVFFGHQSVGMNLLDALPGVYAAHGIPAPLIVEAPANPAGGHVTHAYIGENTRPRSKITDFAAQLRGGLGAGVDVALMKLCFVDITADTDADSLFAAYRDTMAGLARDYPGVVLIHVTAPLTVGASGDNVNRQRYNTLIRRAYGGSGRLFDLAALESTRPDGTRVAGSLDGQPYEALYAGYAADEGHLNETGAARAVTKLLVTIASAHP